MDSSFHSGNDSKGTMISLTKIRLWPDHEMRRGKFGTKILEQTNEMNLGNSKIQEKLNIECGCCLKLYLKMVEVC